MISVIFSPMLSLLIVVPISLIALAPLGYYIGEALAHGVQAIIDFSPILSGFVLGTLRPLMVLTETHHVVRAIVSQQIATYGYTTIGAINYMSTMAQAAGALGVYLIIKDKKTKELALSGTISGFLGVTEPALYSVIIKYKYVFLAVSLGGGIGGAIAIHFGAAEYALVMSSLLTIPATIGDGFIGIVIGLPTSIIVTILLIWLAREKINAVDGNLEESPSGIQNLLVLDSPVSGEVISVDSLPDQTYAEEKIGKSIAVIPSEGKIFAPFNGEVVSVFHTGHALGLVSDTGVELLIHIGIDTVKLNGKYFTPKVQVEDKIEKGDLILEFDKQAIITEGYDPSVIIVITNSDQYSKIDTIKINQKINSLDSLLK